MQCEGQSFFLLVMVLTAMISICTNIHTCRLATEALKSNSEISQQNPACNYRAISKTQTLFGFTFFISNTYTTYMHTYTYKIIV